MRRAGPPAGQELRDRLRRQGRRPHPGRDLRARSSATTTASELGSIGFAKDLREIRRHDQLATLGEIAVGLAHEINNPLEVIVNNLNLLEAYVAKVTLRRGLRGRERAPRLDPRARSTASSASSRQLGEMAHGDEYATREYLPGTLMTDLRATAAAPGRGRRDRHRSRARGPPHPGRRRRPRRLPVAARPAHAGGLQTCWSPPAGARRSRGSRREPVRPRAERRRHARPRRLRALPGARGSADPACRSS